MKVLTACIRNVEMICSEMTTTKTSCDSIHVFILNLLKHEA